MSPDANGILVPQIITVNYYVPTKLNYVGTIYE